MPLLTLGMPGGGATAVLLGAFIMYGIQPGPLLFQNRPDLVWGLIDSMYIGNIMLLILNLPLIGIFVRLLYIPAAILMPLILAISAIGVYAINGSLVELYLSLFFGVMGYIFAGWTFRSRRMVLSLVLGGIMEQSFRQAMTISGGNPKIFVGSTICVVAGGPVGDLDHHAVHPGADQGLKRESRAESAERRPTRAEASARLSVPRPEGSHGFPP